MLEPFYCFYLCNRMLVENTTQSNQIGKTKQNKFKKKKNRRMLSFEEILWKDVLWNFSIYAINTLRPKGLKSLFLTETLFSIETLNRVVLLSAQWTFTTICSLQLMLCNREGLGYCQHERYTVKHPRSNLCAYGTVYYISMEYEAAAQVH